MTCKSCGSVNQGKFIAEMGIHFRGLKDIEKPVVWVFPKLIVCLDCGKWISSCPNMNCVYWQESTPLPRNDLELIV